MIALEKEETYLHDTTERRGTDFSGSKLKQKLPKE